MLDQEHQHGQHIGRQGLKKYLLLQHSMGHMEQKTY